MKTYKASRDENSRLIVFVNNCPLNPRVDLTSSAVLSSSGQFECGYPGTGAAQLSVALLADHTGSVSETARFYQEFMHNVVSKLPRQGWEITGDDIDRFLSQSKAAILTN